MTLLQVLESQHVVNLLDVFPQGLGFVLAFEYMLSDLGEMIANVENPLTDGQIKSYTQMLLMGVRFMHDHSIMHRDLKPANLLIGANGRLKIADLGLSRIFLTEEDERKTGRRRHYSHQVATRWYRAPELLYGARSYTEAVDLWSVGCIFGEMINKSPIFPGENDIDQLGIVIRALGTPNEKIWPGVSQLPDYSKITFPETEPTPLDEILAIGDCSEGAVDLFCSFIAYDASKRLEARQALRHPYFRKENPAPTPLEFMPIPKPKSQGQGTGAHPEFRVDYSIQEIIQDLNNL